MKNFVLYTMTAFIGLSSTAYANDLSRLSGEVLFTSGYMSTNSNLSANGDAVLQDRSTKGSHTNDVVAVPLGSLSYQLGHANNQRVYLGTSRDDLAVGDLAFEVGYQYDFMNGTQLDFAFLPTVVSGEVWSDPYKIGKRQKTDIDGHAFRMKVNNINNSGLSLDMAFATAEVDHEKITDTALHRDYDSYYIKGAYRSMMNAQSGLITSLSYTYHDATGKAATYNQYKTELTYFTQIDSHSLALTGGYAYKDYSGAAERLFDSKKRTDNRYKLFLAYEYANFAGWDNWSLVSLAGANFTTSNIDFYESEEYLVTLGLGYKF